MQEFRVLTQNFKAEFEKASSAAITAVTKSGGNIWTGDVFLLYQDKNLVAQDIFAEERGEEKPTYERFQGGLSLGGPIIANKMTFFGSLRDNRQDRDKSVFFGGSPTRPAEDLSGYLGTFDSPFRSHLGFGEGLVPALRRPDPRPQLQPAPRERDQGLRRPAQRGERDRLHDRRQHRHPAPPDHAARRGSTRRA